MTQNGVLTIFLYVAIAAYAYINIRRGIELYRMLKFHRQYRVQIYELVRIYELVQSLPLGGVITLSTEDWQLIKAQAKIEAEALHPPEKTRKEARAERRDRQHQIPGDDIIGRD